MNGSILVLHLLILFLVLFLKMTQKMNYRLHTNMLYIAKKDLGVKMFYLTVHHFHGTGMVHDGSM